MKRTVLLLLLTTLLAAGCGGALERRKQQVTIGITPNQETVLQPGMRLSLIAGSRAIGEPLTEMQWSIEAVTVPAGGVPPRITNANCDTVTLTIKNQDGVGRCTAELIVPNTALPSVWRVAAMAESESKGTASEAFVLKVVTPARDTGNFRVEAPTLLTTTARGDPIITNDLLTINAQALSELELESLRYQWTVVSSPDTRLQVAGANSSRLQLIPRVPGDYQFRVSASALIDGRDETVTAEVMVVVDDSDRRNQLEVYAGPVQDATARTAVPLAGAVFYNDQPVANVSYAWLQVRGPTVSIADATTPRASFFAPQVWDDTELVFELRANTVIEGRVVSGSSRTVVRVMP